MICANLHGDERRVLGGKDVQTHITLTTATGAFDNMYQIWRTKLSESCLKENRSATTDERKGERHKKRHMSTQEEGVAK